MIDPTIRQAVWSGLGQLSHVSDKPNGNPIGWPSAMASFARVPHTAAKSLESTGIRTGAAPIAPRLHLTNTPAPPDVTITYLSHSTYRIRVGAIDIATDYTGFDGSLGLPTIATMNGIHPNHYTRNPDPSIRHVLRGWPERGQPAQHFLRLEGGSVIRNVTTDLRSAYTGYQPNASSIFIYELAGLCIGHMGNLHHMPTARQLAEIGRLDIMMFPVDGVARLSIAQAKSLADRLGVRVILPMHWFNERRFRQYLGEAAQVFEIDARNVAGFSISIATLPERQVMLALTPETSFRLFRD